MFNRRIFLFSASAASTVPFAPTVAGGHGRIGVFEGKSNHVTRGRAEIVVENGQARVVLLDDFWFDGAPDPKVALGLNGYDKNTLLGPLNANSGKQSYAVPAGVDVSQHNEVWIWCEKYNVPLGVAKIN